MNRNRQASYLVLSFVLGAACALLAPRLFRRAVDRFVFPPSRSEAARSASLDGRVVRFDDGGKRVFVHAQLAEIDSPRKAQQFLRSLQQTVRECRQSWGNDWSASVFSNATYAGYKDEKQLEEVVKDGRWSRAYVGEYDRSSQKLTLNPADPKKVKTLHVALP